MDQWFIQKASFSRPNFARQKCSRILADLVSNDTSPASAAEAILDSVRMSSSKPEDEGFDVVRLLLETVAEFSESHDAIIKLLFAIRDIPPSPNPVYNYLASIHREDYDGLSGLRYLWNPEDKQAPTPTTSGDRWVSYNVFTVKLAESGFDNGYFIFGFFCLRQTLETSRQSRELDFDKHIRLTLFKHPAINAEELMSYDLMAAAKWVLVGGLDMYRRGKTGFGKGWERGLAVKTDLWDGEPGLSRGRWLLWQSRFDHFADRPYVREEVGALSKEASIAIGEFMIE
ncbi:hypothetical protein AA0112_g9226 [Alternaria arborescens]|nr:hypothetical protein AA0112_g9226 [Alternaria arborescens]